MEVDNTGWEGSGWDGVGLKSAQRPKERLRGEACHGEETGEGTGKRRASVRMWEGEKSWFSRSCVCVLDQCREPLYLCVSTKALSQGTAQASATHTTGSEFQPGARPYQHNTIVSLVALFLRCSLSSLSPTYKLLLIIFYAELLSFCPSCSLSLCLSFSLSVEEAAVGPWGL